VRSLGWKAHIPEIFLSPDMLGHPGQACVHGPFFFIEFVVYFFFNFIIQCRVFIKVFSVNFNIFL